MDGVGGSLYLICSLSFCIGKFISSTIWILFIFEHAVNAAPIWWDCIAEEL